MLQTDITVTAKVGNNHEKITRSYPGCRVYPGFCLQSKTSGLLQKDPLIQRKRYEAASVWLSGG